MGVYIIVAILSLIWFVAVLVQLKKIVKLLQYNLQAQMFGGWYKGMKVRCNATRETYTVSTINGDTIIMSEGEYIKDERGAFVYVPKSYKRDELTPIY